MAGRWLAAITCLKKKSEFGLEYFPVEGTVSYSPHINAQKVKTKIGGLLPSVKARHFFSVAFSVASHQMAAILSVQGKGGLNYSTYTSDAAG